MEEIDKDTQELIKRFIETNPGLSTPIGYPPVMLPSVYSTSVTDTYLPTTPILSSDSVLRGYEVYPEARDKKSGEYDGSVGTNSDVEWESVIDEYPTESEYDEKWTVEDKLLSRIARCERYVITHDGSIGDLRYDFNKVKSNVEASRGTINELLSQQRIMEDLLKHQANLIKQQVELIEKLKGRIELLEATGDEF